jgi:hypothetical protein
VAETVRVDFEDRDIVAELEEVFDAVVVLVDDCDFSDDVKAYIVREREVEDETENEDVEDIVGDIEIVILGECRGVALPVALDDGVFDPSPVIDVESVWRAERDLSALTVGVFECELLLDTDEDPVPVRDTVFDAVCETESDANTDALALLVSVAVLDAEFVPTNVADVVAEALRDPDSETLAESLRDIVTEWDTEDVRVDVTEPLDDPDVDVLNEDVAEELGEIDSLLVKLFTADNVSEGLIVAESEGDGDIFADWDGEYEALEVRLGLDEREGDLLPNVERVLELEVERVTELCGDVLSVLVRDDVRVVKGDKESEEVGDGDFDTLGEVEKQEDTEVDGDAMGVKHSLPVALGLREMLALTVTEPVPLGLYEIRAEADIVLLPCAEGVSLAWLVCDNVAETLGETEWLNVTLILVEGETVVVLELLPWSRDALGDGDIEKEGREDFVTLTVPDSRDDVVELRVLFEDFESVAVFVIIFDEDEEKEADFDWRNDLVEDIDAVSKELSDDDFEALVDRESLAVEHEVCVMRSDVPDALLEDDTDEDGERLCVSEGASLESLVWVFVKLCETVSRLLVDALLLKALLRDSRPEYDSRDDCDGEKVPLFVAEEDFEVLDEPLSDTDKW